MDGVFLENLALHAEEILFKRWGRILKKKMMRRGGKKIIPFDGGGVNTMVIEKGRGRHPLKGGNKSMGENL